MRRAFPLLLFVLTACGDTDAEPRSTSMGAPDVEELVALDGREMRRIRDEQTGVSFPFPKSWNVVAGNPLWHAWAREGGPRPDRTVANVAVIVEPVPQTGSQGYLDGVRKEALARAVDGVRQASRKIGAFTATTYRLVWAGPHGPLTEEVFVFVKGNQATRLVAISHDDVRAPFSESLATILEGFQWASGE